jgi:hypothetical protein
MNDDTMLTMGVFLLGAFVFWVIALAHAPVVTLLITFAVILFGGFFSTSGGGDGREQ